MSSILVFLMAQAYGTWTMWAGDPNHQCLQTLKGAITSPVVKWGFDGGSYFEYQFSAVADVDGDGAAEVLAGDLDWDMYCLNGSTGEEKWRFDGSFLSSPAVADLDEDGHPDVVFGLYDEFYCVEGSDASIKWQIPSMGDEVFTAPTIADLDGDGHLDVVVGNQNHWLYCYNGSDGSQKWSAGTGGDLVFAPAVADIDGDGTMEIVVGSYDHRVYCFNGSDGTRRWFYITGNIIHSAATIADLNGDGVKEVLIGSYDGSLYCLNGLDGSMKWSFATSGLQQVTAEPAVADVDGDGVLEVIFGTYDHHVYCLDGLHGSLQWSFDAGEVVHTSGSLADVDGDGRLEYLVPCYGDTLFCLNAEDGSLAWKMHTGKDVHTPFVADVDGDGCSEIVVGTEQQNPQGYRLLVIDDPNNATGCGSLYTDTHEQQPSPEPVFRSNGRSLYLYLPQSTQLSLELYDPVGRLVQVLFKGVLPAGAHSFLPGLGQSGVYMAVLNTGQRNQTVKLIQ